MAKSKLVQINEKIAEQAAGTFSAIETAVTGGYSKIEGAVVDSYTKIEDAFVDRYLTKDGETTAQAKARLKQERP